VKVENPEVAQTPDLRYLRKRVLYRRGFLPGSLSYFVYVLQNDTVGRRYVGQTSDLVRRLEEHNGISDHPHRFTRKFPGEWRLVHQEEYPTRSEAMLRRANPPQAD